jgi:hypothetical protein
LDRDDPHTIEVRVRRFVANEPLELVEQDAFESLLAVADGFLVETSGGKRGLLCAAVPRTTPIR